MRRRAQLLSPGAALLLVPFFLVVTRRCYTRRSARKRGPKLERKTLAVRGDLKSASHTLRRRELRDVCDILPAWEVGFGK